MFSIRAYRLIKAAKKGDVATLARILDTGIHPDSPVYRSSDPYEPTPLHYSIEQGSLECVRELIARGADKDREASQWSYRHFSPVHFAVWHGRLPILQYLISIGCDINKRCLSVETLVRKDVGLTPLHLAAWCANYGNSFINRSDDTVIELAKLLIAAGADVNKCGSHGQTPLFQASFSTGDIRMVTLLVEHGADVNHQDESGQTPLFWAPSDIFYYLISKGADINHRDRQGFTPLRAASVAIWSEWKVKALTELGAKM